jgi:hypothetical protein
VRVTTRNELTASAIAAGADDGFVEAVTGADREVGTDLPCAAGAQASLRTAGFF